jgi:hypothetical protein
LRTLRTGGASVALCALRTGGTSVAWHALRAGGANIALQALRAAQTGRRSDPVSELVDHRQAIHRDCARIDVAVPDVDCILGELGERLGRQLRARRHFRIRPDLDAHVEVTVVEQRRGDARDASELHFEQASSHLHERVRLGPQRRSTDGSRVDSEGHPEERVHIGAAALQRQPSLERQGCRGR